MLTFVPFEKSLLSFADKQYSLFLKPYKDDENEFNDDNIDDDGKNGKSNDDNENCVMVVKIIFLTMTLLLIYLTIKMIID